MAKGQNITINTGELQKKVNSFSLKVSKVEEIFNNINSIMKDIDGKNDVWRSKNALLVANYFSNIQKEFSDVNEKFSNYKQFLIDTMNNYEEEHKRINQNFDNNYQNFDINA